MRNPQLISRSALVGLVAGGLLLCALPASAEPQAAAADAHAQLAAARAVRIAAENRLAGLEIERTQLQSKLSASSSTTEALASDLAAARRTARQRAIDAYISGGDSSKLAAVLASGRPSDATAKTTLMSNQARSALDAAEHYRKLKEASGRTAGDLGTQLDTIDQRIADATSDVEQANALEADDERAVAVADQAASQAALAAEIRATAVRHATVHATAAPVAKPSRRAHGTSTTTTVPVGPMASGTTTTTVPDGASGGMWAALRQCESGGNYQAVSASGRYRGAYQFDQQTWESVGGTGDPAAATPAEQDLRAKLLYEQRGARAWPDCGRNLPST